MATLYQLKGYEGRPIALEAAIELIIKKKNRHWIAYSPHFKTFGYSTKSQESAIKDFRQALNIFFQVHSERKTLEYALTALGWKSKDHSYTKPKYFNIPSYLLEGKTQQYNLAHPDLLPNT